MSSQESPIMPDEILARELEPVIENLLERHISTARMWYPHEFVPWGQGKDYQKGEEWDPEEYPLPQGVQSAIYLNLLTEDNLPYYFQTIDRLSTSEAWDLWARRWTAEENRHAAVIRDWVHIKRPIDPRELEDGRMIQMSGGVVPQPSNLLDGSIYTSFQELATKVAHRNTARYLDVDDEHGRKIMAKVAGDEGLHYNFYVDLALASSQIAASDMVIAVNKVLRDFTMPGTGIPGYAEHARAIAEAGIYDYKKFKEQVVEPTLEHWKIGDMTGLTKEADRARDAIDRRLKTLGRAATLSVA